MFTLQKERTITAVKHLQKLRQSLNELLENRDNLRKQISCLKAEILELQQSTMRLQDERNAISVAWDENKLPLQNTSRVFVDEAITYGRGPEWVYLYTFPAHEQLAHAKNVKLYPMKLGMSTQANVVDRVHQQVSGNSTAISERAVIRLIFRVRSSRDVEMWMHNHLKRIGRQLEGSVGTEWFNTNPLEVEQLFRSYVLQQLDSKHSPDGHIANSEQQS